MEFLNEQSAPGTYVVVTASRSVYEVNIGERGELTVIRRPILNKLLLDGEPLTGVSEISFTTRGGYGLIHWYKERREDYDDPDGPYAGTDRTTSRVVLIAEVPAGPVSIDTIRNAVLAAPDDSGLLEAVNELIEA